MRKPPWIGGKGRTRSFAWRWKKPSNWLRNGGKNFSRDWRDRHIKIELPKVTDAVSLLETQTKVVEAVGNGDLDTEGATVLLKGFAELGTSMERMDIEKRLAAIEERLGSKR